MALAETGGEETSSSSEDGSSGDSSPERRTHHRFPTKLVVVTVLLTVVGVAFGVFVEGWTPLCAVYVLTQVVTTIGYGDLTVKNVWVQEFMAAYVILCLIFFSYGMNIIAQRMADLSAKSLSRHMKSVESTHVGAPLEESVLKKCATEDASILESVGGLEGDNTEVRVKRLESERAHAYVQLYFLTFNEALAATVIFLGFVAFGTLFYGLYERCSCSYGETIVDGCIEEDCEYTGGYKKSLGQAFYMSVITLTTVGFGDFSPRTELGRLVGIPWMLLGVASTVKWLETITKLFFEFSNMRHFDHAPTIDRPLFDKIDETRKGYLTKSDFRIYMLLHHKLVPEVIIDEIDEHYVILAGEDGVLTHEDIDRIRSKHKATLRH